MSNIYDMSYEELLDLFQYVPEDMKATPQWLCWKKQAIGGGRVNKLPANPYTGKVCAKNEESFWVTFEQAIQGVYDWELDGIGFVFAGDYIAIDLDHCVDDSTGEMSELACEIIDDFTSYAEWSPSKHGVHIFCRGKKGESKTKNTQLKIELYGNGYHFVTVTGDIMDKAKCFCNNDQKALDNLIDNYLKPSPEQPTLSEELVYELDEVGHANHTPEEWLKIGLQNDPLLKKLWEGGRPNGDESADDYALVGKLVYWLNRDVEAVFDAFMNSEHYATKSEHHLEKMKRNDYISQTIKKQLGNNQVTAASDRQKTSERVFKVDVEKGGEYLLTDLTDMGNAVLMSTVYNDVLRFVPAWGWCYYDGKSWLTDVDNIAMDSAMKFVDGLLESAQEFYDKMKLNCEEAGLDPFKGEGKMHMAYADALLRHAKGSRMLPRIKAMVELLKSMLHANHYEFDKDSHLFNTEQGIINLNTGEVIPHDSSYMCTNITPFCTDPEQTTPLFTKFMDTITCGDKALAEYIQLVFGSAMHGKVYNENLALAYGVGANGKSTLLKVAHTFFGTYATAIDAELIMSKNASEQQLGMSILMGKRLAIAQETDEGAVMSSAMLKRLCSTDVQVAKRLYRDPMQFTPTHTMFLATNHLPQIKSVDNGTWRRIGLIPFKAIIQEKDMIPDLDLQMIQNESGGIMAWLVEGAIKFAQNNYKVIKPPVVVDAVRDYRMNEDWLSRFIDESCETTPPSEEEHITHTKLYAGYTRWALNNGIRPLSSIAFSKAMQLAGYVKIKKRIGTKTPLVWLDIVLEEAEMQILSQRKRVG